MESLEKVTKIMDARQHTYRRPQYFFVSPSSPIVRERERESDDFDARITCIYRMKEK